MTTFIQPYAVLPLGVQAFGRSWQLTPVLEPLWTLDGDLYGLELLSRLHDAQTGDAAEAAVFFAQAPRAEQQRVLAWQLSLLTLLAPWCADRRVPVTLNLNRRLAMMLLAEPELGEVVRLLARWLRLEVSEDFLKAGAEPTHDPLIVALGRLAPLWLDDFGAGSTGIAWLMGGHFEAVKLDRRLFIELAALPEGAAFMKALSALSMGLGVRTVAEGVASDALMQAARDADMDACQGLLWPAVTVSELGTLPARLPGLTAGRAR